MVTLLKSLADSGLLAPGTPESVANRPARTTYQPTAAGIALFRSRVREGLTEASAASAGFLTAVAYPGILPAAEAIAVLRARAERLRRETGTSPATASSTSCSATCLRPPTSTDGWPSSTVRSTGTATWSGRFEGDQQRFDGR